MRRRTPVDLQHLIAQAKSGRCFICEFLRGTPGYEHVEIYRTGSAIAFLNKYPTLFGYVIVAPIPHVEQVTGDFTESEYLETQRLIYRVSEAIRQELRPERIYLLSLGSQAANAHVHWHIAPLPPGVPLEEQQFYALMHEHGHVDVSSDEQQELAARLRRRLASPGLIS